MRKRSRLVCLTALFVSSFGLLCQTNARAEFEAASVRPNKSTGPASSRFPLGPGDAFVPGRLFSASNQPLIAYLRFAYKLGAGDLPDLPAWVYTDTFDIEARAAGNPTKDEMRAMMQSLLAARFKVATHLEKRTRPVFNLVLAGAQKLGPRLVADPDDGTCPALPESIASRLELPSIPCGGIGPMEGTAPNTARLGGRRVTLAKIAGILTNPFTGVDRPVLDRTGLAGTFDFSLEWAPAPGDDQTPEPALPGGDAGPSFREALQKQLGLKLTSASAQVDTLIIDRVEHPDEN